jgi:hypothetical protein
MAIIPLRVSGWADPVDDVEGSTVVVYELL